MRQAAVQMLWHCVVELQTLCHQLAQSFVLGAGASTIRRGFRRRSNIPHLIPMLRTSENDIASFHHPLAWNPSLRIESLAREAWRTGMRDCSAELASRLLGSLACDASITTSKRVANRRGHHASLTAADRKESHHAVGISWRLVCNVTIHTGRRL